LYLTPTENHWACDIESDDLLENATRIWCVTVINCITKEEREFTDAESFQEFIRDHPECILVGHNFLAFDLVMLNRFYGTRIPPSRVVDTFVLSQLFNPSMPRPQGLKGKKGPHSLEAWGLRVRYPKGDHEDFSALTPEMLKYCRRDTRLTALVFLRLTERMRKVGFSEKGAELEHQAWHIIQNKQRRNGFPFDIRKALGLYTTLRKREEELEREIYKLWPPQFLEVRRFAKALRKNGEYTKGYVDHRGQYPKLVIQPDGSYSAFDWVKFNLGSPPQRVEKLLELGWEPTSWNVNKKTRQKTSPKVDEESLLAFAELSGKPEVLALSKWIVVNSRANTLKGWMDEYNEKTGALHGQLLINSTLRYKHRAPNSANIPAVKTTKGSDGKEHILYGEEGTWAYECRDLYTCGNRDNHDEWSLVGVDGSGIQNRCLVHNLIKVVGEDVVRPFKELALSGDIHKHNINVLGLANKAAAKKFYYTLMMGGQGARLAADQVQFGTKMTAAEGKAKRDAMIASIPGFGDLIKVLEDELNKTGRITLCDDTPILVPLKHMVIPYLLQGDESRLMKQALVYADQEIRANGLSKHVFKVADIHDEWQWRVRNEYVEAFIKLVLPCFPRAGDTFGYRIVIEGDAKVGKTWAETH
jgi:DNA polymerase-1